jgi:hypothetical protein
MKRLLLAVVCTAALFPATLPAAGNDAKGTFVYKGKTVNLKHAYLIKGPDMVTKQPIRRVILSSVDLSKDIAKCAKMMCTDGNLNEGLSLNFEDAPRFNYWMVMNDQKVQYSGTEPVKSFASSADDAKRIAGKLVFDKTAAGGPKVDVEFDAALVKELTAP